MRKVIGAVLGAIAGAWTAYGIMSVVDIAGVGTCVGEGCLPSPAPVVAMGGGIILFVGSTVLWQGAWLVGPPVGLLTALALTVRDGTTFDGGTIALSAFIAACVLLGPLVLGLFMLRGRQRARLAQHLVQTGSRAVAHVQGARQTGVYINERPQVRVAYTIRPLDGSPPFPHEKTQVLGFTEIPPRPGLAWPAWYDPADPSKVAVGAPSGAGFDPSTEATLREFGISLPQAYGYDPRGPQIPGAPA